MLAAAVKDLKAEIASYPGTFDITDDFRPGKMEKQIVIKPGAEALGITMADIATQIRQAYYGDEVLQVQRGKMTSRSWCGIQSRNAGPRPVSMN